MRLLLERTIELLKIQVKENLRLINENQSKFAEMLKDPAAEETKREFEACYAENKKLLIENNDFINLQLMLIDFLDKHKASAALSDDLQQETGENLAEVPIDEDIIFDMTVSEELEFDQLHPLFGNNSFFDKLVGYYTSVEAYEKCSELYKMRDLFTSAR